MFPFYTPFSPPTPPVQSFRRELPDGSKLMVAKNTLLTKAVESKENWTGLANQDYENAWLFVGETISPTIKAYLKFKKNMDSAGKDVSISTAVMDGQVLDQAGVEALKVRQMVAS